MRPSLETFKHVTRCLFEAVDAMHHALSAKPRCCTMILKPANVLLTTGHDPVIIDLRSRQRTDIGAYMGTPDYTAPIFARR